MTWRVNERHAWIVILLEAVMILGILIWIWYALYVAGFVAFPDLPFLKEFNPATDSGEDGQNLKMLVYLLALVAISEYISLYILFSVSRKRLASSKSIGSQERQQAEQMANPNTRLVIRAAFTAAVWIYFLVVYFVLP